MRQHLSVYQRVVLAVGTSLLLCGVLVVALAAAASSAPQLDPGVQPVTFAPGAASQASQGWLDGAADGLRKADQGWSGQQPASQRVASVLPDGDERPLSATEAERTVRRAWQRAKDAGAYRFATDLVQVTYPAPMLANAGRGPQQQAARLEGDVDVAAQRLSLRLWQSAGSVQSRANSVEARIEGGRAYIRAAGAAWQETDDFSGGFAPGNDPLAYLTAMKQVRQVSAAGEDVTRFAFELDGPAFAVYLRDQLEQQLRAKGELPMNVHLDTAAEYRNMTGTGEIWIDDLGMPLRLQVRLVYPEQRNGAHVEAEIQTDFSGFPALASSAPSVLNDPAAWATQALHSSARALGLDSPQAVARSWGMPTGRGGVLLCCLGFTALLIFSRRSRRLYAAVVLAVILSMVVIPLLQNERAVAFFDRQAAREIQQQQAQQDEQIVQEILAQRTSSWDPHRDPLAADEAAQAPAALLLAPNAQPVTVSTPAPGDLCDPNDLADPDGDALHNYDECLIGANPLEADTDQDGLTDGQEVDRLGTAPTIADTDGDHIPDLVEIQGFSYAGQQWYLDPTNPDSNGDGQIDSMECPPLTEGIVITPDVIRAQCDADQDNVPNPFDDDNDNDGVPDRIDLSPNHVLDRNGIAHNGAALHADAAYHREQPFPLLVTGLQPGYPTFVDLQVRPVTLSHLTYALNVLDWPAGDDQGQIQHVKDTTFATSDNPNVRQSGDLAGQYGDMRLTPIMEIEMTGSSVPLKLTDPAATISVRGELSATVNLAQPAANHNNTALTFTFGQAGGHDVKIYTSGCPASGAPLASFAGVSSGGAATVTNQKLTALADAGHALVVSQGVKSVCTVIPNVINGPYSDKMIDLSVLDPYGIGILEGDTQATGGRTLLAYVPLSLAPDATGGARTAFQARMLYWPGTDGNAWTQAHHVRVLWAVQMLTDACDAEGFPLDDDYAQEHPDDYDKQLKSWCTTHRTMDNLQVVQTYDENWYVTGLSVREDHGLDVSVAYLDPFHYPADDENLWQLSWGLGQMFVTGRDCETDVTLRDGGDASVCHSDTYRDLAVFEADSAGLRGGNTTIAGRFDSADRNGNGTPDNEDYANAKGWSADRREVLRWGIPTDALFVETVRYPHEDYMSYLSATVTPRILQQFPTTVSPTLLYAREERYRNVGMAAASVTNGVLSVDANPQDHKEEKLAGLIWGPYRYNPGVDPISNQVIGWESYPVDEYYSMLGDSLTLRFDTNFPDDAGSANAGKMAVARGYYMSLLSGITSRVQACPAGEECGELEGESDEELIAASEELADKIAEVAGDLVLDMMQAYRHLQSRALSEWWQAMGEGLGDSWDGWHVKHAVFESIGEALIDFFVSPWKTLFTSRSWGALAGVSIVVAGALATIALSFILGSSVSGAELAARILLSATVVLATLSLVKAVAKTVKEVAHGVKEFVWESIEGFGARMRMNKVSIVVRIVIGLVITWAAFALEWGLGHMAAGSMAWNNALASAIAGSITTILIFAILTALGPLGEIIWAVMAMIDALVALICNAFLSPEQQESEAGQWLCGGITGLISQTLKWMIYSGAIMVDMDPDEDKGPPWYPRLQLTNFGLDDLVHPELGIVDGNAVRYRISLTNTIDLAPVPISPLEAAWFWEFNDDNLRRSTFEYRWQEEEEEFHKHLSLGDMRSKWKKIDGGRPFYIARTIESEEAFPLPEAGVNQPVELFLSEAYALPDQECWGVLVFAECYITAEKGTAHYNIGEQLVFDVLPATLDEFYQLAQEGSGWTLGWSQDAALSFPTQRDADGDSLSFAEDPSDSHWDSDNDGLSDAYELQTGSDPWLPDSDHDGLSDHQEALLGTNPRLADSDGDGLTDSQEVAGWKIITGLAADGAPQYAWVWSDPLLVDVDGDGLTDFQEKTYGYHPRVPSDPNVLVLQSELWETSGGALAPTDGVVKPGARLAYTATVDNKLNSRTAQGLLSTESPDILNDQGVPPSPFVLQPLQQQTMAGNVDVLQTAASGVYSLTQVAGALITDWQDISGDARLWLRFDEAAGATVYADSSGQIPPRDGHCTVAGGCSADPTGGRFGGALQFSPAGAVHSDVQVAQAAYGLSLWFKTTGSGYLFSAPQAQSGYLLQIWIVEAGIPAVAVGPDGNEEMIVAQGNFADGQWHHLVHTLQGSAGGQRLYIDGLLAAAGSVSALPAVTHPGVNIGGNFSGMIDDVRLFDRGLTPADVEALSNQPVLHLDFDASDRWYDASTFRTAVSCVSPYCPAHAADGVAGLAASFHGDDYLSTAASPALDLRNTPFTLAAWVYPQLYGANDAKDTFPQGILGRRSGEADASPTLQRVGRKIRFGIGTNAGWKAWTSADVLTEQAWNHVALSFDAATGNLKLYVNGLLVGEDATVFYGLTPAASSTSLDIGRSTDVGKLYLGDGHCNKTGDGSNFFCGAAMTDELCMALDGHEVLNKNTDCGDNYQIRRLWTFAQSVTLRMWENDDDPKCGSAPNGGDDDVKLKYDGSNHTTETFDFTRIGDGADVKRDYTDGSYGYFHFTYTNDAIPFNGRLDEVEIYNRVLDAAAVQKLANSMALYLPLDEPPGSTTFQDMGMESRQAACTHCPTTGVTGRINQSAWFEKAKNHYLTLPNGAVNHTTNSLTVAAWIKPHSLAGVQRILASARTQSNDGFGFGVSGADLLFTAFGVHDYVLSSPGLQADQWNHVAAVFDSQNKISFYLNGVLKGTVSGSAAIKADNNDLLLVGATTGSGSSALIEPFDGQIDDLRVYRRVLPAADIQGIFNQAPVLHLLLDESRGATRFVDNAQAGNAGTCSGTRCPATGEAIPGQFGLSADFDGADDLVTVPDSNLLDLDTFTVGAWIMPRSMGIVDYSQALIGKSDTNGNLSNYDLSIAANSLVPLMSWGCVLPYKTAVSAVPLTLNQWNHVMGTFDGHTLRIYVNGSESGHTSASGASCPNSSPLAIGGWINKTQHSFAGRMDEVVIYRTALSSQQVRDIFTYQAGWVEDRQSHTVTVDADLPTVALPIAEGSYLAKQPTIVTVTADDRTSGVVAVTLHTPGGTLTAPRCADVGSTAAWCPTFTPQAQGRQTLTASATDRAGNSATSASRTLYVDDSAPQVTIDGATMQRLDARPGAQQANTWTVHLSGTATDPSLGSGVAGSGVPDDGVRVTLTAPGNVIVGGGSQQAALAGSAWSLDFAIPYARADGQYTVTVQAVDRVALLPGLDAGQVARHTGTAQKQIVVDATGPAVQLDRNAIAGGQIDPAITLAGVATDRPVPVRVAWTGDETAGAAGLTIVCSGPATAYAIYAAGAGTFTAGQAYSWQGSLHRGSSCQVQLTTTAASGGIEGVVQVCDSQVTSWTGDWSAVKNVAFTAEAPTCDPQVAVAGVAQVETAFISTMPGSAFINETPLDGEFLHLPFDDGPDSTGALTFRDISAGNHPGACSGEQCPATGQPGHIGRAARFDGVSNAVSVPQVAGQGTTDFLSIAVWIRPDGAPTGHGTIIARKNLYEVARFSDGTIRWAFNNTSPGWKWVSTGYVAPLNQWTHIVVVYNAGVILTYANGRLVSTVNGSGSISNANYLSIGAWPGVGDFFTGLIDDVRLFDRALSADEVKALMVGSAALLALDFEKAWAAQGTVLPDDSGWMHDGILQTGANDQAGKATTGRVGAYALRFDGVDDYVSVGPDAGLDLSGGQFSQAAWINSESTDNSDHGIMGFQAAGAPAQQRYPGMWVTQANGILAGFGDGVNWNAFTRTGVLQAGWNHVATTFDGAAYTLYVNGAAVYSTADFSGRKPYAGVQQVNVGMAANAYFKGAIDDVRIYPRALPAEEVKGLYLAGWSQATLQGSAGAELRNWSAGAPAGLEGFYQVALRGVDAGGHAQTVDGRAELWRGAADTLAPRVTLQRTALDPSTYRYTVLAQDFNLVEDGFTSPCGAGVITTRVYNVSAWYLAAVGENSAHPSRLYQLGAECQLPAGAVEQATACDSFGNCATVGVTTDGGGAAGTVALPSAGPGVRVVQVAAPAEAMTPAIRFVTTVLTGTHYYEPRTIAVSGLVTGVQSLTSVQVSIAGATGLAALGETAATAPYTTTWRYPWRLESGALPDGETYLATATATSLAGSAVATATLVADVMAPAPVTLTLTADGVPVLPGDTVRVAPVDLQLAWTASTDGSGLAPYRITWARQQTATITTTVHLQDPSGVLADQLMAGEAQRLSVALASRDLRGNERVQVIQPFIVDSPPTPDAIWLSVDGQIGNPQEPYSGWMDSGCTVMGADRRAAAFRSPQQLYASWDERALRLAWTGSTWGSQSDLFIYLDTRPGGAEQTFTPLPVAVTGTVVMLPAELGADTLIWVQDARRATLLRWDGSTWGGALPLSRTEYSFTAGVRGGQTDLYLPFSLLGIQAGAPLGLLAFAAEEPAADVGLRLWATLPGVNPVNSLHVNRNARLAGQGTRFALSHAYRWPALGNDVCPNGADGSVGGSFADSDLQLSITASPSAAAIGGRGGGVFWLADPALAQAELLAFLHHGFPPVNEAQEISYTVHYRNAGSQTAVGVWLALSSVGPLRLLDTTLPLGDIAPGAAGSATFRGVVDRSLSDKELAAVQALVYDAGHGPQGPALDWLWAFQWVDQGAPEQMAIEQPALWVGPGMAELSGYAHDEAGVAQVEVAIASPSGVVSTITCDVARPSEGRWRCPWDVTQSNGGAAPQHGQTFALRMAAIDTFGQRSAWSEAKTVWVDARPPIVTLDRAASGVYSDTVVSSLGSLFGAAYDLAGVGTVRVCVDDDCDDARLHASRVISASWSWQTPDAGALDHVQRTISVTASDRVGNRLPAPLTFAVWVDNVSPTITVTAAISQAHLGALPTVLAGWVGDGGPQVNVSLRVAAPNGVISRQTAARAGAAWWYDLPADAAGRYTLWVDADDLAGNRSSVGPFTVDVSCLMAELTVMSVLAEPASAHPLSVTLTALISNAGPDTVPAGLPAGFYARPAGAPALAVTTQALPPGAVEAVEAQWTPAGGGRYDVNIVLNDPDAPDRLPLCSAPDTHLAPVFLDDVLLYSAWNLISSAVEPSNDDVAVVQRPIRDAYTVILGYDQELLSYQPGLPPHENTLRTIDASHGYWIRTTAAAGPPTPVTPTLEVEPVATLQLVGHSRAAEDQALPLDAGWNLISYLPRQALPVTAALGGIQGRYGAVLGFERTGLSHYPDLDASFNTLGQMAPARGYWINASEAVTLHYPIASVTATVPLTTTPPAGLSPLERLFLIRHTEQVAGVRPTFEWMNFYGRVTLPDGAALPAGTVVLALDPQGVICGATAVTTAGQYGLLACYRDDPYSTDDEGAQPGDDIRLFISTDGVHANGEMIGVGTWSGLGSRQRVPVGSLYLPLALRWSPHEMSWWLPLIIKDWGDAAGDAAPKLAPLDGAGALPDIPDPGLNASFERYTAPGE